MEKGCVAKHSFMSAMSACLLKKFKANIVRTLTTCKHDARCPEIALYKYQEMKDITRDFLVFISEKSTIHCNKAFDHIQ